MLVRQEVKLARLEFARLFASVGTGTALAAIGGVLALLGTFSLFTGIILVAGDQWLRDNYWLAAMIAAVVAGAVAWWLSRRGMAHLSPRRLLPDQTVATLKEDKDWLKRQLTSGGTSR